MTTYFVKVLSSTPFDKISTTTDRIAQNLAVNPLKVENLLKKGKGGIVKASSLAKAVKLAYVFRKAGVLVEVVSQEQPLPSITLTSVPVVIQKSVPLPPLYQSSDFLSDKIEQRSFWRRIPGFRSGNGNIFASLSYAFLALLLLAGFINSLDKSGFFKEVSQQVIATGNIPLRTASTPTSIIEPEVLKLPQLKELDEVNTLTSTVISHDLNDATNTAISNEQATHELDEFFELEVSPLRDGTPRVLGTGTNGMSFLEFIGDQNNLDKATMFIEASKIDKELNAENFLLMSLFTKNLAPEWQEGQQWLADSIPRLLTAPNNKISIVVDNKVIDLTALPKTAVVSLSFNFVQ